ncbi:MAG: hypothetical protein WCP19_14935 [Chloroflexota bacterium]
MYFIGFGSNSVWMLRSSTLPTVDVQTGISVLVGVTVWVLVGVLVGVIVLTGEGCFVGVMDEPDGALVGAAAADENTVVLQEFNKTRPMR